MKTIEIIGKNVEEAVQKGLSELNTTRDKVDVEVVSEGSKGLFGFIGCKDAEVKLTLKKDYKEDARKYLNDILKCMGIDAQIEIRETQSTLKINLVGNNMGIIIGHRGETLDALQYLVSLVVNKNDSCDYKRIILDTEGYRGKREQTLKRLAQKMGDKVKQKKKSIKLEPMNPYERRIIHSALQNDDKIQTYSEGQEPYRRVVIDYKRN